MLMGAGSERVTTQIPVTLEDHSFVCRLNRHTPPDLMHIAAGVYHTRVSVCLCRVCTMKDFVLSTLWGRSSYHHPFADGLNCGILVLRLMVCELVWLLLLECKVL